MPTLPDAGRLGGGPTRGRGGHRSGLAVRGEEHAAPVSARCSRSAAVLGSSSWPRSLRGRPASCAWPMAARSGRPSRPRVAGYRPERHRPGVVARSAAWYRRSCPECDESCQRQRGRQGAAVEPRPQVNPPSANPCDGSIRTGTQEMAETGRFAAPGSARKWRHPPRRSSTCPPRSSTPTASSSRTAAGRSSTRKPTTGLVEKCSWSWSPRAEHLEGASLGELEGGEVGLLLAGGQAEDRLENAPRAGYSLVLVSTEPMRLTRILVAPRSGAWRPRSCPVAAGCPRV
jgi:hypothetical protein